jgi:hypothetical protein
MASLVFRQRCRARRVVPRARQGNDEAACFPSSSVFLWLACYRAHYQKGALSMPENSVTIRLGTVADYPPARAVIAETFAFHQQAAPMFFQESDAPPPTLAAIEELLQDGAGAWFLTEQEGSVIGFVTAQLRPPAQGPYLAPERRALVQLPVAANLQPKREIDLERLQKEQAPTSTSAPEVLVPTRLHQRA